MNEMQVHENPDAYESEVQKNINRQIELQKEAKSKLEQTREKKSFADKTLFDFDEDINELEGVRERYKQPEKIVFQMPERFKV